MTVQVQPAELVRAAKKAIGDERDAELARRLAAYGLDAISAARSIARWRAGETQPEYPATMALLHLAGWLSEDRVAAGLAEASRAQVEAEEAERLAQDAREEPLQDEEETD